MSSYFLSYARADAEFALRVAEDLRASGVDVWIDQIDILPSQRWDRALEAALRAAAGVLVVLSPRSVASENVMDEVGFALDQGKDVIPVLYEPCDVPIRISRLQRIDFTREYALAIGRLKSALSGEAAQRPERAPHAWDAEVLRRAERDLVLYVGPIASKFVATAAAQAGDTAELYRLLAARISDAAERAAFLKRAPGSDTAAPSAPSAERFSRALLDEISSALTKYLGPIAPHVVEQTAREASDADELCERLGTRIADLHARVAFLKHLGTLR
jgi:hypothetical protein